MRVTDAKSWVLGLATAALASGVITGCDPIPRRQLSAEEKATDMMWIYSQFGENYAPLAMKEQLYGFNYSTLKDKYMTAAKATKDNDEFYDLMFQFVAEFKDAHTSASLTNSSLPGRAQVAFLGFNGIRNGDGLMVKSLLPTIAKGSAYPIKVGDKITKVNGTKLPDVVRTQQLKFRDIGNAEGNLTYFMNKIFTRISTVNGLPTDKDVSLTLERGGKEITVTLPWVVKDLAKFQEDQEKATKKTSTASTSTAERSENMLMISDDQKSTVLKFNFIGFDGRISTPWQTIQRIMAGIGNTLHNRFNDGFQFVDNVAEWVPVADTAGAEKKTTPLENLSQQRTLMTDAVYLSGSEIYPAYVAPVDILDKDGKKAGGKKLVGYIYVDTFSPASSEGALKEFKATIATMQALGAKDLIIDTINNGGGSLVLGMKMAQALSNKKVEMPKMQFRLSDTWIEEFEKSSLSGDSDAEKEYSRRMYVEFISQYQAGKRLSDPYSAEALSPFDITPNPDTQPMRTVLLINEMCASMCDIFAGILQDNQMATIMGANSMGAGGNVVNHQQAPNSHLEVRQTESLILRKDGSYLENAGVKPEIALKVNEYAKDKFGFVINKAAEVLAKPADVKTTEIKPAGTAPATAPANGTTPAPIKTADISQ